MDVYDQSIDISRGNIFVRHWNPEPKNSDPPIILLHDSLGCVELWRDFPAELFKRVNRPVIAYDRLGFGRSSIRKNQPSRDFIEEEAELFFPELLSALSCEKYLLFGHSVGGAMALSIAAQDPRCNGVITEAAQVFVEERTQTGIREAKTNFKDPGQFSKLIKWHGSRAEWVLKAWTDVWLSSEFSNWSLEQILPLVECPVLAIHGDRDEFGSLAFPQMIVDDVGGRATALILENCGHTPHREYHEEVLRAIQSFLNDTAL